MTLTNFVVACSQYDESANDPSANDPKKPARTYILSSLISMLVTIFLIATFGKFLWNGYAVKYLTFCRPVNSPVDIIALSILANLILG
jgi:hypothetical protein